MAAAAAAPAVSTFWSAYRTRENKASNRNVISCRKNEDQPGRKINEVDNKDKDKNKAGGGGGGLWIAFERLKERLSPERNGDWKDLTLVSLSFALYVYVSQKIVCAYCLWLNNNNSW
ncbi:hypothetical protein M569_05935 [Genlisea aurea]|uniref:Uncharacterized protein n=1 Tax=Genlisea aurea TaxID=192259 RepID=S8CNY9_9LAMI|nr:hypothetical protein M569_05935 [Genlisea aurea]